MNWILVRMRTVILIDMCLISIVQEVSLGQDVAARCRDRQEKEKLIKGERQEENPTASRIAEENLTESVI